MIFRSVGDDERLELLIADTHRLLYSHDFELRICGYEVVPNDKSIGNCRYVKSGDVLQSDDLLRQQPRMPTTIKDEPVTRSGELS